MVTVIIIIALVFITVFFYIRQPKFGRSPSGESLARLEQAANFKNGKFQNQSITPQLAEGYTMRRVLLDYLFKKTPNRKPANIIPSIKTDLKALPKSTNLVVWFGHSSYYLQLQGKSFLIDPVFSGNASPLPGTNKAFAGADEYNPEDMPGIDYLLITHDHYDHLDYKTVLALKSKIRNIICGLGVAGHFERWGFDPGIIVENNWNADMMLENNIELYTYPARHFSGRGFNNNNTLWLSYLLKTKTLTLYLGGDSGYDGHFKMIGEQHHSIDLALLDNGQYNEAWRYIHMLPEDTLQAARDLHVKRLMPVHSSKFMMANHAWDEPLSRMKTLSSEAGIPLVTPMIGEVVYLDDDMQSFESWWEKV